MRRETQNVLLVLVGGALIKIVLDGTYLRYVKPWSGPVVLVAGAVLVALAVAAIVRDVRGARVPAEHGDAGHGHDHDHGHHATPAAWLLLLPVLAILLVAPPALGSASVTGLGARSVAVSADATYPPLPPGEAPPLGVLDVVSRTVADPHGELTRRDVSVTGFLVPATAPGGGVDVARLVITCCAADASAVRIHVTGGPADLAPAVPGAPDRWVELRGRVVDGTGTAAEGHVPTLRVATWSPVAPPARVYEY